MYGCVEVRTKKLHRGLRMYGDAVGNINIPELLAFHEKNGKIGTMSMYNFGQNKGVVEVGVDGTIAALECFMGDGIA